MDKGAETPLQDNPLSVDDWCCRPFDYLYDPTAIDEALRRAIVYHANVNLI
jgi:hypothetical protein